MMRDHSSLAPFFILFAYFLTASYVVSAQSLPACAQSCVAVTKTKCKPTDFACACSDGKYIPKLKHCIETLCDAWPQHEAHLYLVDLCRTYGAPLKNDQFEHIEARQIEPISGFDVSFLPAPQTSELPAAPTTLSDTSFGPDSSLTIPTDLSSFETSAKETGVTSVSRTGPLDTLANPTSTSPSVGNANSDNGQDGGGKGGGLSTGEKVGLGLGIPLGVLIIAGLIGLGFWLGRRHKKKEEATSTSEEQPQMQEYSGRAELDQGAMYMGHEMPTKGNTAEMPAAVPHNYTQQQAHRQRHGEGLVQREGYEAGWDLGDGFEHQSWASQPPEYRPHYASTTFPPPSQDWGQQMPQELPERNASVRREAGDSGNE